VPPSNGFYEMLEIDESGLRLNVRNREDTSKKQWRWRTLIRKIFMLYSRKLLLLMVIILLIILFVPRRRKNDDLVLVVVVPYTRKDTKAVVELFSRWDKMSPCDSGISDRPVLSLYENLNRDQMLEKKLENQIRKYDFMKCFREIRFDYADLTPEQDMYPYGPSFMFWKLMLLRQGTSVSRLNPRCVLLTEPDTYGFVITLTHSLTLSLSLSLSRYIH